MPNNLNTHYIYVGATTADPFPPSLSDDENHTAHNAKDDKNFTTDVNPGDIIIWQAVGDVTSLEEIAYKTGSHLFAQIPTKQNDGTWKGVIGNFANVPKGGLIEEYDISYIVNNGMFYTQDPKLSFKK